MVSFTRRFVPANKDTEESLSSDPQILEECQKALEQCKNYSFYDFCNLIERTGFEFKRQCGSHRIYNHPDFENGPPNYDTLNIQNYKGKAKPYQIKMFIDFIKNAKRKKHDR